jgi:hypothetical protein
MAAPPCIFDTVKQEKVVPEKVVPEKVIVSNDQKPSMINLGFITFNTNHISTICHLHGEDTPTITRIEINMNNGDRFILDNDNDTFRVKMKSSGDSEFSSYSLKGTKTICDLYIELGNHQNK